MEDLSSTIKICVVSRLLVIILQSVFNLIIPDHISDTFQTPGLNNSSFGDNVIQKLFGGLRQWDGQYFSHISIHGYTYENTLAFFPFFPYISYYLSLPLKRLTYFVSHENLVFLAGLILNLITFILALISLYKLTTKIFNDTKISRLSTIAFCFNPASIFFSAYYSESLFSFLTFSGLFCLEAEKLLPAALFFAFSGGTRSNGVITCGFLIYNCFKNVFNYMVNSNDINVRFIIHRFVRLSLHLFLCLLPFVWFQVFACILYCIPYEIILPITSEVKIYGENRGYIMPSETLPSWCYHNIPLAYSYVQSHYWDVGFLRYFSIKQIPNFLLVLPLLCIIIPYVYHNMKIFWGRQPFDVKLEIILADKRTVYILHVAALICFCILCINVQVTTRLICSSSPVVYWAITSYLAKDYDEAIRELKEIKKNQINTLNNSLWVLKWLFVNGTKSTKLILFYCGSYFLLGTAMFPNALPWT